MTQDGTTIPGGCLCGAVRYEARPGTHAAVHCHCSLCRRAAGAPVVTWLEVVELRFTAGEPRTYRSSTFASRSFCPACGTQLTFQFDDPSRNRDVSVASLDDPSAFPPDRHIFDGDRFAWLELDPDLPRFKGETPE